MKKLTIKQYQILNIVTVIASLVINGVATSLPLNGRTPEEISDRLFTPASDLPEGVERIPLKTIHSNHVPMLAPAAVLRNVDCKRIGLEPQRCFKNAEKLIQALPQIRNKVMDVFKPYPPGVDTDPDHMIYSGGFFSNQDRQLMNKIHTIAPGKLAQLSWPFKDSRLKEMLFRYRARNYPDTLSQDESRLWQSQRIERLNRPADNRQLNPETFRLEIMAARQSHAEDSKAMNILDQLESWGNDICSAD